jgi:hypothetical protein
MEALELIKRALFCSGVCFVMYNTEALVYYAQLLGLKRFFKIEEYFCHKILSNNKKLNYFDFILQKKSNFFLALLACPYCFGFWVCFLACQFRIFDVFVVYWIFLFSYRLITYARNGN